MTSEEAIKWIDELYTRADITDKYGDMEDMQPYEEALDMAIRALEQEPRWIPVSEGLPEPGRYDDEDFSDTVQVTMQITPTYKMVHNAYYCFSEHKWYSETFCIGDVLAWRPLPKPYKAESEE